MSRSRVFYHRAGKRLIGYRTIEVTLKEDEIKILNALAANSMMSRNLFVQNMISMTIKQSGYFVAGDKVHVPYQSSLS